ncbi:MAG: oxygenase MpaB family protein [Rhodoferax sp.]
MVFQMLKGHPVETRTIALFAMGIPLLIGLAGWWRWDPDAVVDVDGAGAAASGVPDARLAHLQYAADPLADNAVAAMLGDVPAALNGQAADAAALAQHLALIAQVNRQFASWTTNQSLQDWQPDSPALPTAVTQALQTYLQQGQVLPDWADAGKIARAEALFMDVGPLSCTLLFCSSLPECYVVPDLSAVLHAAGQLEAHTEHRVRATAAMTFPVMLRGGLTTPDGSGVAQILKVRLIHATIRHLILHGSPAHALAVDRAVPGQGLGGQPRRDGDMYQTLLELGWNVPHDGLPCNQEELAYTLLTFGYVFLRSLRRLGLGLAPADEEAYLHAWNVVGHVLGIRRELMADTMAQAAALFGQMQALGRARPYLPDPRPPLGNALMAAMESVIPFKVMKAFPTLLTRHLCGHSSAEAIGVDGRVSWVSKALFALLMALAGTVDGVARLVVPGFSLSRLLTRVLGYHFMSRILMDQTRPLKLPSHLLNQVSQTLGGWGNDPGAPGWVNQLEDRLTKPGQWQFPVSANPPS